MSGLLGGLDVFSGAWTLGGGAAGGSKEGGGDGDQDEADHEMMGGFGLGILAD